MKLSDHPTVKAYREDKIKSPQPPAILSSAQLKEMALTAGADDAGLIELSRDAMADYRQDLLDAMPGTRSVMVLAFHVNQNHLKGLAHSVADYEFKQVWTDANHATRRLVAQLGRMGIKAMNMPAGFPYEANQNHFKRHSSHLSRDVPGQSAPGIPAGSIRGTQCDLSLHLYRG